MAALLYRDSPREIRPLNERATKGSNWTWRYSRVNSSVILRLRLRLQQLRNDFCCRANRASSSSLSFSQYNLTGMYSLFRSTICLNIAGMYSLSLFRSTICLNIAGMYTLSLFRSTICLNITNVCIHIHTHSLSLSSARKEIARHTDNIPTFRCPSSHAIPIKKEYTSLERRTPQIFSVGLVFLFRRHIYYLLLLHSKTVRQNYLGIEWRTRERERERERESVCIYNVKKCSCLFFFCWSSRKCSNYLYWSLCTGLLLLRALYIRIEIDF